MANVVPQIAVVRGENAAGFAAAFNQPGEQPVAPRPGRSVRLPVTYDRPFQVHEAQCVARPREFVSDIDPSAVPHLAAVNRAVMREKFVAAPEPQAGNSDEVNVVRDQGSRSIHVVRIPGFRPCSDEIRDGRRRGARGQLIHGVNALPMSGKNVAVLPLLT
jgi:hypothetical protein